MKVCIIKDAFLSCIKESGVSYLCLLQNCYVQGSVDEPIVKAIAVSKKYNVSGAVRVHGGGFAGTILNVLKKENLREFIEKMERFYKKEDILPLSVRKVGTIVL